MLASGRRFLIDYWWMTTFPGLAIVLVGTQGSHEDGVMAAATCLVALTVYFATVLMGRSLEAAK